MELKCKVCGKPAVWSQRFGKPLCTHHKLVATLGYLDTQPKMEVRRVERCSK